MTQPKQQTSRSEEVIQKHREFLWPAVANFYQHPLVTDHASMQYVWDADGKKYLDFFGGILTVGVGHCNPKVTARIHEQAGRFIHTSTLYPNEAIVALAEKLAQITPGTLQKSYFTPSGTEANEAAILLARMASPSYEIVALRNAYSGGSNLARGVTAISSWRKAGTVSVGVSHAVSPYCYRCPLHLKYPDCGIACAQDVENVIQTTTSGTIAAFIAEPIQGVGGFVTPPPEYFKIVYRIVKDYGGAFIADEVQTGFGRTGTKWFGIEHWEVTPDIITCAKSLGNGTPIGAAITTSELAAKFQGSAISTFGGNPLSTVAARAVIEVIEEENLRENTRVVGGYLRSRLEELQAKHALIGDVRGMGMMQALELVRDHQTKEPAPQETLQLLERTRENGLLVGRGGMFGNVIRFGPPMNIAKTDVDEAIAVLDKSFTEVSRSAAR
jgi:4-aminobutyrate aminotransferase-like enzyme